MHNWLAKQQITWQFNLSRAPWWWGGGEGQFERMVGLVKKTLYKTTGKANLSWKELEEMLLDIEIVLNNRPLSYVESDIQMPILTPNSLMMVEPNLIPESVADEEDSDLRQRMKYLQRYKDAWWKRWSSEYLKALRKRHNMKNKTKEMSLKPGDVVLIKGDERNRGQWTIEWWKSNRRRRWCSACTVRWRAGKSFLERTIQHLYPMELSCDLTKQNHVLNAEAPEFTTKGPRRLAAMVAGENIQLIAKEEEKEQ